MKVIISGGGTGGHVFPAIAIADALKKADETIDIKFVGAKGKLEMEKVPKAGYPIEGLWISGFHRKLTLRNLAFPFKLMHSLWKANSIVRKFKPDVVVGVGGFASGPTLKMANRQGVPTLLQEQNSYAGVTNKLLAKEAKTICVAYDKMERYFPADKIVLTGNPIRKDIKNLKGTREAAIAHFGLSPEKKTIVLTGGSLGAKALNEGMAASMKWIKAHPEVQILWQAGKLYIEDFSKEEVAQLPNVTITAFIDRMDWAYLLADVVICRAGASTISELCVVGKTAILVPSPNVAEDHQTKNAMALVEKNAAVLVKNAEVSTEMLATAIDLLENEEKRKDLELNIKQLALPDAAAKIAQDVLNFER